MLRNGAIAMLFLFAVGRPAEASLDARSANELLTQHNRYRASLSLPQLRWSAQLANKAQRWAEHLAAIGRMEHSGSGENLASGPSGAYSLTQLADLWGRERVYFVAGNFPAISATRNWMDTGHYSQMVWRTTTQVGCGFARGPGLDFLVCNYNPPGNVMGQRPF
jgi:uncharacterized protein YkwD